MVRSIPQLKLPQNYNEDTEDEEMVDANEEEEEDLGEEFVFLCLLSLCPP